ncbi:MAG: aldo/keto reductase, partial [Candidatus Latescibacteria bacterium]|nr:aldo/keto reductase [Candidatus Latescibacterota bacterium]
MDYRRLGLAGVKVSPICLGTAFRGQDDEAICIRTIERAIDLGCNFIDTANFYGRGRSESIVGKALKGKREDIVLASKVCSPMGDGPNDRGLSRFAIVREVERSLTRLETDHLDLYILHQFDPHVRQEETMRTLDDLVRQGKVRYVGISNFSASQLTQTLWVCDNGSLESPVSLQSCYNLLARIDIESEVMPLCRRHGVGITTFSPLAIGLLTGRFRRGQPFPADTPWG